MHINDPPQQQQFSPTNPTFTHITHSNPLGVVNIVGIIVGVTVGGFVLFVVIPIIICVVCCCCFAGGGTASSRHPHTVGTITPAPAATTATVVTTDPHPQPSCWCGFQAGSTTCLYCTAYRNMYLPTPTTGFVVVFQCFSFYTTLYAANQSFLHLFHIPCIMMYLQFGSTRLVHNNGVDHNDLCRCSKEEPGGTSSCTLKE